MKTVVEYTDVKQPANRYPKRIVSPLRPGPCCWTDIEKIGEHEQDDHWVFRYKRCRRCGFTVRLVLERLPDVAREAELRSVLANTFMRNL